VRNLEPMVSSQRYENKEDNRKEKLKVEIVLLYKCTILDQLFSIIDFVFRKCFIKRKTFIKSTYFDIHKKNAAIFHVRGAQSKAEKTSEKIITQQSLVLTILNMRRSSRNKRKVMDTTRYRIGDCFSIYVSQKNKNAKNSQKMTPAQRVNKMDLTESLQGLPLETQTENHDEKGPQNKAPKQNSWIVKRNNQEPTLNAQEETRMKVEKKKKFKNLKLTKNWEKTGITGISGNTTGND
jgi:hypothetical protein